MTKDKMIITIPMMALTIVFFADSLASSLPPAVMYRKPPTIRKMTATSPAIAKRIFIMTIRMSVMLVWFGSPEAVPSGISNCAAARSGIATMVALAIRILNLAIVLIFFILLFLTKGLYNVFNNLDLVILIYQQVKYIIPYFRQ